MLLYTKISQLTTFSLQSSDLGKITNLLATDMGVIEQRLYNLTILAAFPIMLIGATTLMIIRTGLFVGISSVVTIIVLVVLSSLVSNQGSKFVKKVYESKDKRVEKTT